MRAAAGRSRSTHLRRKVCLLLWCLWALSTSGSEEAPFVGNWPHERAVWRPLSLTRVKVGGFLGRHIDANNRSSIPAALKSPIPRAFEALSRGEPVPPECRRLATDSDFYKWLEGACYAVAYDPSLKGLRSRIDRYVDMIVSLQRPDGYLSTGISPAEPFDKRVWHDLYVAGHFFEAAVAHFRATGSRKLLQAACRLADFYLKELERGNPYFKAVGTREHPEVELALVRLARAAGEKRYLNFASAVARLYRLGPEVAEVCAGGGATHAVRFCYLMAGRAELYLETGLEEFYRFLPELWSELVRTRMYVTGGIGKGERIPVEPYDLPQTIPESKSRDIAETCASVALMFYSWRMHGITGESRCYDVIERILYNHYLGALSPDHLAIFYYNPLKRVGDLTGVTDHGGNPVQRTRLPRIHSTACCFPNAWRFFAQLPEYIFSVRKNGLSVNLYTKAEARHTFENGTRILLKLSTLYPAEGNVGLTILLSRPADFELSFRVPWWCKEAVLELPDGSVRKGGGGRYLTVRRTWSSGDRLKLSLPIRPVVLASRPEIKSNRGQVAFRWGPLVYCLEKQDAGGIGLEDLVVLLDPSDPQSAVELAGRRIRGLPCLKIKAGRRRVFVPPEEPYFPAPPACPQAVREVTLIPFFLRATRSADSRWITWIPCR